MRPHLTLHDSVATVLGYLTQTDKPGTLRPPEPIGGTIPWLGLAPTLHHAQRMPRPSRHAKNVLHVTLSLPEGMIADRPAWAEMAQMAIGGLGLPARRIPWLAFRHRDTTCDHLHIMLMAATFASRQLALPDLQRRCHEVHVRLCRHLGLTSPRYHRPAAGSRLEVFCPSRRLRSANRRRMASDIGTALIRWQPTSMPGLQAALVASGSPVRVEEVKKADHRVITFTLGQTQMPGRARHGSPGLGAARPAAGAAELRLAASEDRGIAAASDPRAKRAGPSDHRARRRPVRRRRRALDLLLLARRICRGLGLAARPAIRRGDYSVRIGFEDGSAVRIHPDIVLLARPGPARASMARSFAQALAQAKRWISGPEDMAWPRPRPGGPATPLAGTAEALRAHMAARLRGCRPVCLAKDPSLRQRGAALWKDFVGSGPDVATQVDVVLVLTPQCLSALGTPSALALERIEALSAGHPGITVAAVLTRAACLACCRWTGSGSLCSHG